MIVAISKNRGIGKDNDLIFRIPEDMKRFRDITSHHPIIMGRKTFEPMSKNPLKNRTNIVVTSDPNFSSEFENVVITNSLEKALSIAQEKPGSEEVFIIGGGQIYKEGIKYADRLYLTIVDREVDADVFFPDYSEFKKVVFEENHEWEGLKFKYITLER